MMYNEPYMPENNTVLPLLSAAMQLPTSLASKNEEVKLPRLPASKYCPVKSSSAFAVDAQVRLTNP